MSAVSKIKAYLKIGIIFLFLLFVLSLLKYMGDLLYSYGPVISKKDISRPAIIICLAGGRGRINAAIGLYNRGFGQSLFIIGAGRKTNLNSIIKNLKPNVRAGMSREKIQRVVIENESRNTIENAFAISHLLRRHPENAKIILITSSYHMRRSLLILNKVLKEKREIYPYIPKETKNITKKNWTYSWSSIVLTMVESVKLILAHIFVPLLEIF